MKVGVTSSLTAEVNHQHYVSAWRAMKLLHKRSSDCKEGITIRSTNDSQKEADVHL